MTKNRIRIISKERIMAVVRNKEFWLECVLAVLLFWFCSYKLDESVMPILLDDEYGYWANSSYFMGLDWSSITGNIAYYSYGYSLILLALRMIAPWLNVGGWDSMYQLATTFNLLMLVASFLIAVRLCRRYMKNMNWIVRCVACFVVMLYPAYKIYSHITLSECALTFFFWIFLYTMHRVTDKPSILNHAAFALVSVYMYTIHQRTLAQFITAIIIVLLVRLRRISRLRDTAVFGAAMCGGLMLHSVIKQNLQNTLYMGKPPVGAAGLLSYALTKKTALMIVLFLIAMLLLYLIEHGKSRLVFVMVLAGAVTAGVYVAGRAGAGNAAADALPDRLAMNDFAGQWEKVRNIFTVPGLIRLGTSIVGKWFYLVAGSGLVICWGMRNLIVNAFWITVDCVRRVFHALLGKTDNGLRRLGGDAARYLWLFGVFLAWAGTFMICAIYKEGLFKVDDLVHGRYIEYTIGILLIYSVDILLGERHWLIMLGICTVLYGAAGMYCQYVYDQLQRTHFELAHAVMFGRVFWNYESPTGKIQQLTGYILPLTVLFFMVFKLFANSIAKIPGQMRLNAAIVTVRCVLALMIPLAAWTHLSDAIINNYVISRNLKQSGALPDIASWINVLSREGDVYFVSDSLNYKQASLLQFMLMDREVSLVPMAEVDFDKDDIFIINNMYLGEPVIEEKCEVVLTLGSYALVINNSRQLMETWRIYKGVLPE